MTDNRLGGAQNVTTYSYDTANNLVTETLPNNLQSTFQYDPENRLSSMTAGQSGFLYDLGPTGIRTRATESAARPRGVSTASTDSLAKPSRSCMRSVRIVSL